MHELPANDNPASLGALRHEAERLYEQLLIDRGDIERRLLDAGREDPLKMLTGKGAMDRAIENARVMLSRLDGTDVAGVAPRREPPTPTPTVRRRAETSVRGERVR
jgi:hypothetical protein